MKWILLSVFFSTSLWSASYQVTSEKNCSALDLRTPLLEEIRNQKSISWCYAFSAADMLTYTFNLSEKVSAADVAINYNDSDLGTFIRWINTTFSSRRTQSSSETFMMAHQNGFNKIALERGMRDGYCPERVFPSESWVKMTRDGDRFVESKSDLKPAMLDIYQLIQNQKLLTVENLPYYFHFKNVESPEEFLSLLKGSKPDNFYSKLRTQVCQFDRIHFASTYSVAMELKNGWTFVSMNKNLNLGRLVGMDYDDRITSDHTNRSITMSELHTSAIVGRRWNVLKKECAYLIHDSRGKGCDRYDPTYECLGGQIWVEESLLFPNIVSTVTILAPKR
jgi:hypothetical protein